VLAYVFWHRGAEGVALEEYEAANVRFQRSLATQPPGGFVGSVCLAAAELPWLGGGGPGYEDWYVVEDFAALGVINEAAIGRGHRTSHDVAARLSGEGAGGVYRLIDGSPDLGGVALATWITPPRGHHQQLLDDFLADGVEPGHASLWRRQMVLGPAPELCLLSCEAGAGVRATRLPQGWSTAVVARSPL
jgi:hypothetical protein